MSATVQNMDIDTQIIGGGQLSSEASLNVRLPENVKLTQYLVGNGDTVHEGDAIAKVDKVSVMTAITEVQETLDYLAEEIADASDDTASTSVKALAGGTVKVIYAKEGEAVQDVMLDHGALAVLSLDDIMAVKIERETTLDVGDTVIVTMADGTEVDGRVKANLEGVLTITMEDDDYSVGAKVTVTTEDGERLGTGELYIFSLWSATAYSGTVDDILVDENDSVYIGQYLFSLEDTGNTAQFQRLIDQRQEYEELMQELFTMYRTQTITAPCDGIVTGVDEDGAYLLSDDGSGWFAALLSFFSEEEKDGFMAYAARVTEVRADGMTMLLDPTVTYVEDMLELSTVPADLSAMTEPWNYSGDTTIYTQSAEGLLLEAGNAKAGDVLLAVGDAEQVYWFVVLKGSREAVQAVQTENKDGGVFAFLLSDSESTGNEGTGNEGTGNEGTGNEGSGDEGTGSEGTGSEGTGDEDNDDEGDDNDSDDQLEPTVTIITSALNPGVVGQPYTSSLQAADGTNVLRGTWAASGLPAGLEMDPDTGEISGTPVAAGTSTVTISFTCNETCVVKEFTMTIEESGAGVPGGMPGGMPSGGSMSAGGGMTMGGMVQVQTFETYTLDKLTIASVTSQEHMTVSITIDELDITKIYVGQSAVVSVDALGGEQFDAQITEISNSGDNSGGNSKFTVEVTLAKSGEILPGMYSSAFITLETNEEAPCIPVAALEKDGTDTIVYTSYDEDRGTLGDPVTVTIGCSDGENVEIVAGLDLGEVCYYEYYDTYVGSDVPEQGGFSLNMMGRR